MPIALCPTARSSGPPACGADGHTGNSAARERLNVRALPLRLIADRPSKEQREHDPGMHAFAMSAAMSGACPMAAGTLRGAAARTKVQTPADRLRADDIVRVDDPCPVSSAVRAQAARNQAARNQAETAIECRKSVPGALVPIVSIGAIIAYELV